MTGKDFFFSKYDVFAGFYAEIFFIQKWRKKYEINEQIRLQQVAR